MRSLVSATSVLIQYDDECRRSAINVVEYAQSTLKELLIISCCVCLPIRCSTLVILINCPLPFNSDPSQHELLDIRLDNYPVLRRLGLNISDDRLCRLAEYLRGVPKSYVGELQVSVVTNFTNRYWGDWTRLDRAIIDRAQFPGLWFLKLRLLWREPTEEDLEWFFRKLNVSMNTDRQTLCTLTRVVQVGTCALDLFNVWGLF